MRPQEGRERESGGPKQTLRCVPVKAAPSGRASLRFLFATNCVPLPQRPYVMRSSTPANEILQIFHKVHPSYPAAWSLEMKSLLRKVIVLNVAEAMNASVRLGCKLAGCRCLLRDTHNKNKWKHCSFPSCTIKRHICNDLRNCKISVKYKPVAYCLNQCSSEVPLNIFNFPFLTSAN